ncbi:response regulator [Halobiforma lacisalsi AJ5]|uniref:Response regulator n=1 Tax=Natronobacterium lacisalsi AJ5 TaxID=358396 RepID=M0LR74_NATLA|nr:response regulator [Halobiforma lacisalsi]APW99739.1 response regulator [Halobiforma lacisalsi AJ5]EMA36087.1 response regulator receiver protein [Halobiforma lacisalsi AJ5]
MSADTQCDVLLVEDDPGDATLVEEAFAATAGDTRLRVADDGYEALHYLKRAGNADPNALPDLALVDLQLPGKDGCELLEAIRADPQLRCLPVIMLTGSDDADDVRRCYEASANAYLTKPTDLDGYVGVAELIERFWFDHVQLPPVSQSP